MRSLVGMAVFWIGCLGCNETKPCVAMGGESELLSAAQVVRVDVYGERASCDGSAVAAGAPAAQLSRSFLAGQPITVEVAAGQHTLVLSSYADSAGTQLIGSACTEANFTKGQDACIALSLAPAPDGGGGGCVNNSDCTGGLPRCTLDHRCVGCLVDDDCKTGAAVYCDPSRSLCVECRSSADCAMGLQCSAAGVCSQSCDPAAGQGCPSGLDCCDKLCVDTHHDALHCGGCGNACTGGDTLCCNGECANPATSRTHCGGCGNTCSTLNATPSCSNGSCAFNCQGAFVHCMNGNTGCETPSNTVTNCGGCGNACVPNNATSDSCGTQCTYVCAPGYGDCTKIGANTDGCESPLNTTTNCGGCGNTCDTAHSVGTACDGTTCTYTGCQPGYIDCSSTGANTDGCETMATPPHNDGLGQTYDLPCTPLATPGDGSTYSLAMAQAASAAWAPSGTIGTRGCASSQCLTNTYSGGCAMWCYEKSLAGRVRQAATCVCPDHNDATWN